MIPSRQASNSPTFAIEIHQLTRLFGEITAVDHLDLRVDYGKIFGLLGPNGAGKSTTIKMLTTILPPSSGTALVGGFDILREPATVRRTIGYVPQLLSADSALTGYENLMLSAKLYAMPKEERALRIDDVLALMGLTDSARKLV